MDDLTRLAKAQQLVQLERIKQIQFYLEAIRHEQRKSAATRR